MFDLLLDIGQEQQPLYLQIYKQIRHHIQTGAIPSGTKLPSIRSLQLQLNISKTPIETAYQMLSAEGYVVNKARSGIFAVHIGELPTHQQASNKLMDTGPKLSSNEKLKGDKTVIDFNPFGVDVDMFPIRNWKRMINNVLEDLSGSIGEYGNMQGEYDLRKVLCEYLRSSRGVTCLPEQIVIGSGISYSINLLTKLVKDMRNVAFEEPGFDQVRELFLLNEYNVLPINVDSRSFHIKELEESKAEMVYVTPSHQYPTGRVMPYAEREHLLNWANRKNAYIIEDDYDGEYRYLGKPIPSLQSLDQRGRVIYIGTFSKAFTPALRMNYMVLPMELSEKLAKIPHMLSCPSRIEQWAMKTFIEQGHWYRHIRRMRNTYKRKHQRLMELIQTHFKNQLEITGHSAGLHLQVTAKTRLSADELIVRALDKGVKIYDFQKAWMIPNESGYPTLYLGFGSISEPDMEKGIQLLKEAWSGVFEE